MELTERWVRLDETKRPLFQGLARADSVSLDPHKWLYVPLDSGCLLFRDEATARAAFSFDEADYIKIHEQDEQESFAFWNYGPELSQTFPRAKNLGDAAVLRCASHRCCY